MIENDDLTNLRASVAELNEDEKLTLAIVLCAKCTTEVFRVQNSYREVLKTAFESSAKFDRAAKLSFARELIGFCQDAEEDADDNGLDEPCDGYPGYYDEDCS